MTLMYSGVLNICELLLVTPSLARHKTFGVLLVRHFMQDIRTMYCFGY